jgi:hypothetical protein
MDMWVAPRQIDVVIQVTRKDNVNTPSAVHLVRERGSFSIQIPRDGRLHGNSLDTPRTSRGATASLGRRSMASLPDHEPVGDCS